VRFAVVSRQARRVLTLKLLARARVRFFVVGRRVVDALFTASIVSDDAAAGGKYEAQEVFSLAARSAGTEQLEAAKEEV